MTPWGEMKPSVEFSGVDGYTHQWGRMRLYGGLIVENIVQAVSRDLMAEAMLRVEAAGYGTPVLSVHDEIVCEIPEGFGSLEEFESIMRQLPAWGEGCPVATEGWQRIQVS
jgi:DNA polymerase